MLGPLAPEIQADLCDGIEERSVCTLADGLVRENETQKRWSPDHQPGHPRLLGHPS